MSVKKRELLKGPSFVPIPPKGKDKIVFIDPFAFVLFHQQSVC